MDYGEGGRGSAAALHLQHRAGFQITGRPASICAAASVAVDRRRGLTAGD